jgi:hypothetical protein
MTAKPSRMPSNKRVQRTVTRRGGDGAGVARMFARVGRRTLRSNSSRAPNKQLQRTVTRRRGDGASAPFHYALAPRFTRQRAAAELRR